MANSRFDSLVGADQIDQSAETAGWYYAPPAGGIVSSTADVPVKAAGAGLNRNYVTGATITADALSAANELVIKDGSIVMARIRIQTGGIPNGLPVSFSPPLRGTAATAVNIALTGSTTGGVVVSVQGFVGKN